MKKEELEELAHIKKEIQSLEKRIAVIEKQSQMVSDVVQNGYKRHAVIYGVDVKRAYKLQSLHEKYRKFKIALIDKQNEIEEYIENIPLAEIRQIFRYRYIDDKNWVQIAHEMNKLYKNGKYTEESVRKKHDRFLEKI